MSDAERMVLEDSLKVAIDTERANFRLWKIVLLESAINVILAIALLVAVYG